MPLRRKKNGMKTCVAERNYNKSTATVAATQGIPFRNLRRQ